MSEFKLNMLNEFSVKNIIWEYSEKEEDDMRRPYKDSQVSLIGKGGYGSVYKIVDKDIVVKYSVYEGTSERLSWKNEHEGKDEPSEEDEKKAFLDDVIYEVETQNYINDNVKSIDGTPVTPRVLNAYVMKNRQGEQYSYIFMEYLPGIPFGKVIDKDIYGQIHTILQYCTIPIYKSIKTQVEIILSKIHSLDIAHNDLLMNNIIVQFTKDKKPIVKIIDFGQATPLDLSVYLYAKRARSGKRPDEVTYHNVISLLEKGIEIITINMGDNIDNKKNLWSFAKVSKSLKKKSKKSVKKSKRLLKKK